MKFRKSSDLLGTISLVVLASVPFVALAGTPANQVVKPTQKVLTLNVASTGKTPLLADNTASPPTSKSHDFPAHAQITPSAKNLPLAIKVGKGTLTINGFLSVVGFWQDQPYGPANGVFGTFPVPVSATQINNTGDSITGGDIRNSRLMVTFSAPLSNGWLAGGFLSSDLEGGFNGSGIVSGQQQNPRIRQMFITLAKANTLIKIGEQVTLTAVQFPYSLAHIPEPNGFFWANGTWWYPGVTVTQKYHTGTSTVAVSGGIFEGNYSGPGSTTNYETAGNAGFKPQIEGRVIFSGKAVGGSAWSAFIMGHYQSINLNGPFGIPAAGTPPKMSYSSNLVEAGGSFTHGPFVLKGNFQSGQGMANNLFDYIQSGAIKFYGGWAQAGFHFQPDWAIYAAYYYNHPNTADVVVWGGHFLTGKAFTATLAYDLGSYGLALEWMHNNQRYTTGGVESTITGNQVTLSAIYRF